MHEHQPGQDQPGEQPARQEPPSGPWDPAEQVGDVYAVEINDAGQVESAERLRPTPSIWVGSWLDYNNGVLHGDWIAADREEAAIWQDIQAMLARSPTAGQQSGETAEDWGIFDNDNFGPLRIGEQDDVGWISAVGRGIAEHGPAFAAYADVVEETEALANFEDDYLGTWPSVEAYAESFAEDVGYKQLLDKALPDSIRPYVQLDTDAIARDMHAGGDIHVISAEDGGVWIFAAR